MRGLRSRYRLPITSLILTLIALALIAGPSEAQESEFGIFIVRPAQGVTFYSGPSSLLYSLPVSGWITGQGIDFTQVNVRLEVFDGQNLVVTISENALTDGSFEFYATANPENSDIDFPAEVMVLGCADVCHISGDIDLPAGALTLRLSAESPDGRRATAERQIKIDRSTYASLPVRVVHADNPDVPLEGVQVNGSTRLYLWRARNSTGVSASDGLAYLQVEALNLASTRYVIGVEPIVIDGVLYESTQTAGVVLPPGATTASVVTLLVSSQMGQISGRLPRFASTPKTPLPIWLIDPEDGSSRQVEVSDNGSYQWTGLPLDNYILAMDPDHLAQKGLSCSPAEVDLSHTVSATIEMPVTPLEGEILIGSVQDEKSNPLPFAWITPQKYGAAHRVLPSSGDFTVAGLSQESVPVVASAPGFYSQAQVFEADPNQPVKITLKKRPDTASLAWGSGEITIPGESQATVSDHRITLERGWLWGQGADAQAWHIQTARVEVRLQSANFALENFSERGEWLYILEGEAEIRKISNDPYILVQAGEMVNLSNKGPLTAVKSDPVVISALQSGKDAILDTWEPTLGAQIRDRLARIGVGTAQMVTFITSIMVFISLVLVPLGVVYSAIRRKSRQSIVSGGH